ncbi:MAG TPA: hypothetical protein VNN18_08960 [Candidatus Xenobia bacterium]|nr:hypothetical protein [Candidatus Xenobia bacterium]
MRRAAVLLQVIALLAAVSVAGAQSQQTPPPEKKKPRKVWTNEDLSGIGGNINVVGTAAPPPAEAQPEKAAATKDDAVWEELDTLRIIKADVEKNLANNRRWLENLNEEYRAASDAGRIDTILQGRAELEARIADYEAQLVQVNAQIAELEKFTKGKKRPAKPKPAAAPKPATPPAAEGGGTQEPKPTAEQPPPPPPPPSSL